MLLHAAVALFVTTQVGAGLATGVKVGEIGPDSALIWVRAAATAERNSTGLHIAGQPAKPLDEGVRIEDLEGECPGAPGMVRAVVELDAATLKQTEWMAGGDLRLVIEPDRGSGGQAATIELALDPGQRSISAAGPATTLAPGRYSVKAELRPKSGRLPLQVTTFAIVPPDTAAIDAARKAGRAAEAGQPVTFLHLGVGFNPQNRTRLAIMGGIYLAGVLLIDLIMRQMGGEGFQQLSQLAAHPAALSPEQAQAILNEALPALLTGLLLLTPLVMATWFAPALVLFDGFSTGNAMWWSLWACAVTWRPLLTYSVLLGLLGVVAMLIPFGLGLLVFLPWVLCSTYAAYRAIFLPATPA